MNSIAYNVFAFISKYEMYIMSTHKLTFKTLHIEQDYTYISRSKSKISFI